MAAQKTARASPELRKGSTQPALPSVLHHHPGHKHRIKYLFYERLFQPSTMNEICAFLGISRLPTNPERYSNLGTSAPLPDDIRTAFRSAFAPQYAFIQNCFGGMVPDQWDKCHSLGNTHKDIA